MVRAARRHTDHGERRPIQGHRPADDARIASQLPFPERMAEDRDRLGAISAEREAAQAELSALQRRLDLAGVVRQARA